MPRALIKNNECSVIEAIKSNSPKFIEKFQLVLFKKTRAVKRSGLDCSGALLAIFIKTR